VRGLPRRRSSHRGAVGDGRSASARGASLRFEALVDALVTAGLAKWKIPEELVFWDVPFPETASGKVQRNQLQEQCTRFDRVLAPRLS